MQAFQLPQCEKPTIERKAGKASLSSNPPLEDNRTLCTLSISEQLIAIDTFFGLSFFASMHLRQFYWKMWLDSEEFGKR